jgi:hypothetical protein
MVCFIIFFNAGCATTVSTFPIVYTHNPGTEFEILGTVLFRSRTSVGYNTVFEEARRQFPTTDYVIDIMIDKHEITTSYHIIVAGARILYQTLFGTDINLRGKDTVHEYTVRGTAIQYIRRNSDGEIITEPIPRADAAPRPETPSFPAVTQTQRPPRASSLERHNWLSCELSFLGVGLRYENDVNDFLTLGLNGFYNLSVNTNSTGLLGAIRIFSEMFFLELGMGWGVIELESRIEDNGFIMAPGIGLRFGGQDGFISSLFFNVPIVFGDRVDARVRVGFSAGGAW